MTQKSINFLYEEDMEKSIENTVTKVTSVTNGTPEKDSKITKVTLVTDVSRPTGDED